MMVGTVALLCGIVLCLAIAGLVWAHSTCDPGVVSEFTARGNFTEFKKNQCSWDVPMRAFIEEVAARVGLLTSSNTWTNVNDFSAAAVELPNSTTCLSTLCDAASEYNTVCVDSDATSGERLYLCESTGWVLQGPATTVFNVKSYGAVGDGSTDDRAAIQSAISACNTAGGGVVYFPQSTTSYVVNSASGILFSNASDCTFRGAGPYASVIDVSALVTGLQSSGSSTNIAFEDMGFIGASTTTISINGYYNTGFRFENVRFRLTGAKNLGIAAQGLSGLRIRNALFEGDGEGAQSGRAILLQRGMQDVEIRDSRFEYLYDGITIDTGTAGEEPSEGIRIRNNHFNMGWWTIKALHTNSGGTVTYTATVLTDTAAAFGTLAANTDIRVMATRQTGTFTAAAGSMHTKVVDSAATFSTNSVTRGDIIRSGTKFAVVLSVQSETILWVDEWRDTSTYQVGPSPATAASYTIYGLTLGRRSSNTATTITVARWYTVTGATATTPSAGTLYEVMYEHPNYNLNSEAGKLIVTDNLFRRGWSDQVNVLGNDGVICSNLFEDGQDIAVTLGSGASRWLVCNNRILHQGTNGLWVGTGTDNQVVGNTILDTVWTTTASNSSGIQVRGGDRTALAFNTIDRGSSSSQPFGISIDDATADQVNDTVLTGNRTRSSTTAGFAQIDTDAINTRLQGNDFDSVSDNGTGTYTRLEVLGGQLKATPSTVGSAANGIDIVNGHSTNSITSGAIAATVSGGGTSGSPNQVTDANCDYCTVAGGYDNLIGDAIASTVSGGAHHRVSNTGGHATIGGGSTHTISGAISYPTIAGGQSNTVSATNATVGGGTTNTASGTSATVGGGTTNTASGTQATVAGGASNQATASSATIGGGTTNTAGGTAATVAGGSTNSISASTDYATISGGLSNSMTGGASTNYSAIAGGRSNTIASVQYASIPGGQSNNVSATYGSASGFQASVSSSNWYGMDCHASGQVAAAGDAQECRGVVRRQTTDATQTTLYLDGAGTANRLRLPTDTTWTFVIVITARRTDADNESAGYKCEGVIDNNAGTTALVGTITKTVLAEDTAAWDIDCVATDGATDALEVKVTGEAAKTINWVAHAQLVQVTG